MSYSLNEELAYVIVDVLTKAEIINTKLITIDEKKSVNEHLLSFELEPEHLSRAQRVLNIISEGPIE